MSLGQTRPHTCTNWQLPHGQTRPHTHTYCAIEIYTPTDVSRPHTRTYGQMPLGQTRPHTAHTVQQKLSHAKLCIYSAISLYIIIYIYMETPTVTLSQAWPLADTYRAAEFITCQVIYLFNNFAIHIYVVIPHSAPTWPHTHSYYAPKIITCHFISVQHSQTPIFKILNRCLSVITCLLTACSSFSSIILFFYVFWQYCSYFHSHSFSPVASSSGRVLPLKMSSLVFYLFIYLFLLFLLFQIFSSQVVSNSLLNLINSFSCSGHPFFSLFSFFFLHPY